MTLSIYSDRMSTPRLFLPLELVGRLQDLTESSLGERQKRSLGLRKFLRNSQRADRLEKHVRIIYPTNQFPLWPPFHTFLVILDIDCLVFWVFSDVLVRAVR